MPREPIEFLGLSGLIIRAEEDCRLCPELKYHGPRSLHPNAKLQTFQATCKCLSFTDTDRDFETGLVNKATLTWTSCGRVFVQDPYGEPKEVHQFTEGVCEDAPDVPY